MTSTKTTIGERLQQLRGSKKIREIADEAGVSEANWSRWEADKSVPSSQSLFKIAAKLGVDAKWILNGENVGSVNDAGERYGFQVPTGIPDDIPVVGRGRGGRGSYSVDGFPVGEGFKRVRRPYDVDDPNAFGVEVEGVSMSPKFESGDIVICSPKKGWRSGNYVVVVTKEGEALVKKIKDQGESVILSSIAPGFDPVLMHKSEIRGIHRIVWIKPK